MAQSSIDPGFNPLYSSDPGNMWNPRYGSIYVNRDQQAIPIDCRRAHRWVIRYALARGKLRRCYEKEFTHEEYWDVDGTEMTDFEFQRWRQIKDVLDKASEQAKMNVDI